MGFKAKAKKQMPANPMAKGWDQTAKSFPVKAGKAGKNVGKKGKK